MQLPYILLPTPLSHLLLVSVALKLLWVMLVMGICIFRALMVYFFLLLFLLLLLIIFFLLLLLAHMNRFLTRLPVELTRFLLLLRFCSRALLIFSFRLAHLGRCLLSLAL